MEHAFGFFNDLTKITTLYGDRINRVMFKPLEDQTLQGVGSDRFGNILIDVRSLKPVDEVEKPGCLGSLNHLTNVMSLISDKKGALKDGAKIAFTYDLASNQKTTIVTSITCATGRTKAVYMASDPFLSKSGAKTSSLMEQEWVMELDIDEESVLGFDEAHKIHLSSSTGDKNDLVVLRIIDDQVVVCFGEIEAGKNDPKTQTVLSRKIKGEIEGLNMILSAALLRATMRAMGPDGGIAQMSPYALSIRSATKYVSYTITLTGQKN